MFYQLPPVGNRIHLSGVNAVGSTLEKFFVPWVPRFYTSGTAALAAAIEAAIRMRRVENPEVVLPAYGCPDLVSAAIFSGARPVLVDLEPERPWLDLDQLESRITASTAAIVAVSLLGIPERMAALREIAGRSTALLIEDSAQSFPLQGNASFWHGDLVVLSFGRGKPVGLLGGGALLYRDPDLGSLLAAESKRPPRDRFYRLKATAYNLLTSPRLYWIPQGLPFLELGETRYQPLTDSGPMEMERRRLLGINVIKYQEDNLNVQARVAALVRSLGQSSLVFTDLPAACGTPERRRLLRYPLLTDLAIRNLCYRRLRRAGLGASIMYPASLPNIPGLEGLLAGQGEFPAAADFASRLLTLPVHERVRIADLRKMQQILGQYGG